MHRERCALDAGLFGVGRVEHLDWVLVLFGPTDVHPHQHLGPVRRVHPAGARPDVDQRLALVVLAGEQRAHFHRLDVFAQLLQLGVGLGEIVGSAFFGSQLVHHGQVVDALPELLDPAQLALRVGQLAGDLLGARLVVPQVRVRGLVLELFDSTAQPVDVEHPLHRGQGGVEGGDVGLTIGIHRTSR